MQYFKFVFCICYYAITGIVVLLLLLLFIITFLYFFNFAISFRDEKSVDFYYLKINKEWLK